MLRRLPPLLAALLATGLAACGGDDSSTPTATTSLTQPPALALKRPAKGELVFTGAASPTTFSGVVLDGTYTVRFEQHAPENPQQDFAGETPFTARLRREGSRGAGEQLFGAASATGQRTLTKHGRYVLEVTFGDFPYAVRFTPRR